MADDLEQDDLGIDEGTDLDEGLDGENKVEKRIKGLSNKVKLTAKERDDAAAAKKQAEAERDNAKKEVEFYSAFSDVSDKYPNAKEHKDAIKEKVLAGYSVEDAAVSVLAKEGKLTAAVPPRQSPAGGSATTSLNGGEPKSLNEMTREDKRAAVIEEMNKGNIGID